MNNDPVILIHGLFGYGPGELGPFNYWGTAMEVDSPQPKFEASVGPISSAHDRACELLAQIKGVKTDYGKKHSKKFKHKRFGRDYSKNGFQPFYPEWSEKKPVHLIGHSLGGPTMRCAQHLLATDHYGWGSNGNWIKSITGISPVHNGTTFTYMMGSDEKSGLVRKDGLVNGFIRLLEIFTAATRAELDEFYDFDLDHWGFKRNKDESLFDYLERVSRSPFARGKDNAMYSLTIQGGIEGNKTWKTYPNTYYFNYVTEQTHDGWISDQHFPDWRMNPALIAPAVYMGAKQFKKKPYKNFNAEDWYENDGAVNAFSQMYPRTAGDHPVGSVFKSDHVGGFEPGMWYWCWLHGWDHLDVVALPQWSQRNKLKKLYSHLYQRLANL